MTWNKVVQTIARVIPRRRGPFWHLLLNAKEVHSRLFDEYRFEMDLAMGYAQKMLFLKPDVYEWETQRMMRRLVRPGMTVLDIGANTGYFTLLLAQRVGPAGRVYAFEPEPRNFALLSRNVQANRLTQVRCVPLALSDKRGVATLQLDGFNDGGHTLGDVGKRARPLIPGNCPHVEVATTRLDDFLADDKVGQVDFMKVDVEGAEIMVFQGATDLLVSPSAPPIVCEVGDLTLRQFGKTERDLRSLLYDMGYKSYDLASLAELSVDGTVTRLTNILFMKAGQRP